MFELPIHSDVPAVDPVSTSEACASWETALELYYAELCEYALHFVGSADTAQDIVHDLFLHLWDTRSPRDGVRLTKPYLYAAIRNRALKSLRHRRVVAAWVEQVAREEPPTAESPSDLYVQRELEDAIARALTELPARCREIFLLRRQEQLSYDEIAERTGVSLGTVKSHMWRAAMLLKEKLGPYLAGALTLLADIDPMLH
jgi:RNA polymerase sigma-70 factor (ECF subfamily)